MQWICNTKVLIVGLGLMGGSYARALKRLGYTVTAIDTRREAVDYALENGIIDKGYATVEKDAVGTSDAVIFALYPHVFKEWIRQYQHLFKSGAFLTDVTGVKAGVVYEIQAMLRPDVEFIAAHPMAGREVSGVENSDESIFRKANYIVTPTPANSEVAVEWCKNLGRILGFAHISVLTPEEHDDKIAFVSQLTHCISVALMTCNGDPLLADYTGDSFRDLTRIAKINDVMWSELFLLNKDALLKHMDAFLAEVNAMRQMIEEGDVAGMRKKMQLSAARRAAFDHPGR